MISILANPDGSHAESFFWDRLLDITHLDPRNVLHKGYLSTITKTGDMKRRHYYIHKTSLFLTKEEKLLPLKSSCLKWKVIEPFIEEATSSVRYGFRLVNGSRHRDFFTQSSDDLDAWLDSLSLVGIMIDLDNDFSKERILGQGSFAKVYLGIDNNDSKKYAIKSIDKSIIHKKPQMIAAIKNEIEIMKSLDHPYTVKLHKVYEDKENVHLILDYVEGGSLYNKLIKGGPYSEEKAAKLIRKMLKLLDYLATKKVVHRDIKLENIMLVSDKSSSNFKLADFGLATFGTSDLILKCGSPGYVAPEILKNSPYSSKVDVFSTGVCLFMLLSGRSPFGGKNIQDTLAKNRDAVIRLNDDRWKHISADAISFLMSLLQINPNLRNTAREAMKHNWFSKFQNHQIRVNRRPSALDTPIITRRQFLTNGNLDREEEKEQGHLQSRFPEINSRFKREAECPDISTKDNCNLIQNIEGVTADTLKIPTVIAARRNSNVH